MRVKLQTAAAFALMAFSTLSPALADKGEIKIGAIITLSGPAASLGDPVQKALQLIVAHYNSQGGMNGRHVSIVTYDSEGNSGKAVQLFRRLVESDKVQAVLGPSSTGEAMALISVANELKVPMISFGAGKDIISPATPYVFKVPPTDELEIKQLVGDFSDRGIKKLAVLFASGPYGQSGANQLKALAPTKGISLVAEEQTQPLDTDMTAQIVRIRDSNPDAMVIWAADPAATLITKQAIALGFKKPIYNSPAVADPRFIEKAGGAAEGTYVQSSRMLIAPQLPNSSSQKAGLMWLTEAYRKQFNQLPPQNAGHPYDALLLIEHATKTVEGEVTPTAIAKGMETAKFCGANGCFQMSPTDHNGLANDAMVLLKAKGAVWELDK
jgi:branched-chain amino acid transport system substrate-binding protein